MKYSNSRLLLALTFSVGLGLIPSCGGGKNSSGGGSGGTSSMTGTAGDNSGGFAGSPLSCDEECSDDGNPCTEDVCNTETGTCGVPRTGNSCDDGIFCNGADSCEDGACKAHEGDPCEAIGQACDEGRDGCECEVDADCPGDVEGEWGACIYTDSCVNRGSRTRSIIKYSCTRGACEGNVEIEVNANAEDCVRNTENLRCNPGNFCEKARCDDQECRPVTECKGFFPLRTCGHKINNCEDSDTGPYCDQEAETCNQCAKDSHCSGDDVCCGGSCQTPDQPCDSAESP